MSSPFIQAALKADRLRHAAKTVYRMSMPGDGRSMWYSRDGVFDPIIPEVESLPMPIDSFRQDLGGIWLSSVDDPTLLDLWFPGIVGQLESLGFVTRTYVARHWHQLPHEIVFDLSTASEVSP